MTPDTPVSSGPAAGGPSWGAGGKRTGPKPRFTLDDVIDAALKLGIGAFSLGGVAGELGVSTPSLYRVVDSRDDLVGLCLARIAEGVVPPDPTLTWQEQLRTYVDDMWMLLEKYPGIGLVILERPGAHVAVQNYFRQLAASVDAAGFPGDQDVLDFVLDFLGDTTLVTHIAVDTMRRETEPGVSGFDLTVRRLESEAAASGGPTHIAADDSWLERGYLDRKVDFILDGIASGLQSAPLRSPGRTQPQFP